MNTPNTTGSAIFSGAVVMMPQTEEERYMSQHPIAASLRWRARLAKSAAAYNSLDSISVLDDAKKEQDDSTQSRQEVARRSRSLNPVDGVAALAVGASLLTLQSVPLEILSTTASLLTAVLGPYLSFQDRRIRKVGTIRRLQNELRYDVDALQLQNKQLKKTLFDLKDRVKELEEVETELRQLCNNDTAVLRRMVSLVEQQEQINAQTKQLLQNKIVQTILRVAVESDRDQNGCLSPQEVEVLLIRLQQTQGIEVNESRLRAMLAADRSLASVLRILREVVCETTSDSEDWIIRVKPKTR